MPCDKLPKRHAPRLELNGTRLDAGLALLDSIPVLLNQHIAGVSVCVEGVEQLRSREGGAPQPAVL